MVVMTRPAVALLFGMYAAIGATAVGHGEDRWLLARILPVVFGFLLFSVAHWPPLPYGAVLALVALMTAAQATTMFRHGPITGLTVPVVKDVRV